MLVFLKAKTGMTTLSNRIKEARLRSGLSQERLGLEIGLEPESASTRMNRYERGTRTPDLGLIERLAHQLDLPVAYFYSASDDEAELLQLFHRLDEAARRQVVLFASELTTPHP